MSKATDVLTWHHRSNKCRHVCVHVFLERKAEPGHAAILDLDQVVRVARQLCCYHMLGPRDGGHNLPHMFEHSVRVKILPTERKDWDLERELKLLDADAGDAHVLRRSHH